MFQHVPRSWGAALTFDLGAWYSIALADLRVFPESRNLLPRFLKQSELGPEGAREKLVRRALTGQATLCFHLREWAGQTSALEVDLPEPPLVLILGVQDGPALDQLLNQLGPIEKRVVDSYSKRGSLGWKRLSNPEAVAFSLNSSQAALSGLYSLHQAWKLGVLGRDCLSEYAPVCRSNQKAGVCELVIGANLWPWPCLWANNSGSEQFKTCQQNCKNLSTGLEMYASDHQGHYPGSGRPERSLRNSFRAVHR